jgi:hypothetical protein
VVANGDLKGVPFMRKYHVIAVAGVIVVGFAVKLFFFTAPSVAADAGAFKGSGMDVSHMHENVVYAPAHPTHDMTFVYSHGE